MTEPTTAAGRDLLKHGENGTGNTLRDDILAIEAEARQQNWQVHTHGPHEDRGTACREYHLNGRLVGACKIIQATSAALPPSAPPDGCGRHGGYRVASCDHCATLPLSAPPALDVELLIRAMTIARPFVDFGSPEQYGKRTAAEYARLQEPDR